MKIRTNHHIPMIEIFPEGNNERFVVNCFPEIIWKGDVDKAHKGMGLKISFKKDKGKYCPFCGKYNPKR